MPRRNTICTFKNIRKTVGCCIQMVYFVMYKAVVVLKYWFFGSVCEDSEVFNDL